MKENDFQWSKCVALSSKCYWLTVATGAVYTIGRGGVDVSHDLASDDRKQIARVYVGGWLSSPSPFLKGQVLLLLDKLLRLQFPQGRLLPLDSGVCFRYLKVGKGVVTYIWRTSVLHRALSLALKTILDLTGSLQSSAWRDSKCPLMVCACEQSCVTLEELAPCTTTSLSTSTTIIIKKKKFCWMRQEYW